MLIENFEVWFVKNDFPIPDRLNGITKVKESSHIHVCGSSQNRRASSWSNPHQAPPGCPLKYGTPIKRSQMGDAGWNPI